MSTEDRNPRSINLDKLSAVEIVELMNSEERAAFDAVDRAAPDLAVVATKAAEAFLNGGRVIYVGSGTSGRLAALDAAEMPPTFGVDADRFVAVVSGGDEAATKAKEDAEDDESAAMSALRDLSISGIDVVVGIAASGTTPFVLSAIRFARSQDVWTCGIANNASSPLLTVGHHGVLLDTGPEVLTGSTRLKAGTAQKLALNRISTAAMVLAGKTVSNLMVDVKAKNTKLRERCVRIVCELAGCDSDVAREALEASGWSVRDALNRP